MPFIVMIYKPGELPGKDEIGRFTTRADAKKALKDELTVTYNTLIDLKRRVSKASLKRTQFRVHRGETVIDYGDYRHVLLELP